LVDVRPPPRVIENGCFAKVWALPAREFRRGLDKSGQPFPARRKATRIKLEQLECGNKLVDLKLRTLGLGAIEIPHELDAAQGRQKTKNDHDDEQFEKGHALFVLKRAKRSIERPSYHHWKAISLTLRIVESIA